MSGDQIGRRLTKAQQAKFLLTSVAPAIIQPEEANRLIDFVIDQSQLLGEATVERMTTNEKDIRYIDMPGGILREATCGADAVESVTITNTNKCLRTVSLDALFYLCDDDLEDGLTGAQLEQQVLRMAGDQIANELDFMSLMWNADSSYSTNAATSPAVVNANVLHLRDGWYRQLQHGNILDAGSIDADRSLSFNKLNCLKTTMPTKFRTNPAAQRIYMATDMAERDFISLHQGRETNLGDSSYMGDLQLRHGLTPIVPLALLPTDIQNCGCGSLDEANGTFMFITEPANLIAGIERNITFERERVAREHRTWFIWTWRADVTLFNEDATALMDCMQLTVCGPGACDPAELLSKCNACLDLGSGGEPTP
jgi:hypothetical protein